jgi:hypothetical protein
MWVGRLALRHPLEDETNWVEYFVVVLDWRRIESDEVALSSFGCWVG